LQQKPVQQKKKQQQQKQEKPQKQPEDNIQALGALSAEIKSKLSILGLMPPSPLAEVLQERHYLDNTSLSSYDDDCNVNMNKFESNRYWSS
jgi:hypothetical protein